MESGKHCLPTNHRPGVRGCAPLPSPVGDGSGNERLVVSQPSSAGRRIAAIIGRRAALQPLKLRPITAPNFVAVGCRHKATPRRHRLPAPPTLRSPPVASSSRVPAYLSIL
ncbi:hypothetical protein ASPTUDRAFT_61430 [Aspergillus tubingensis CBS 134.48]|uniref:Uncharacterized protein n=1 Tax=Aspergillus tubingensis (strain CBS 134.48) TaxID=767770 RepID=A0A1L9NFK1_ASPTC|nr:hypothetical protein ASPTUDRAFT_61430 [Aspergillus tubingensis CBS 134.48]